MLEASSNRTDSTECMTVTAMCRLVEGQSAQVLAGADTWHGDSQGKGRQQDSS